jgi:hypothetical protein
MKKLIFILGFIITSLSLKAQTTITVNDCPLRIAPNTDQVVTLIFPRGTFPGREKTVVFKIKPTNSGTVQINKMRNDFVNAETFSPSDQYITLDLVDGQTVFIKFLTAGDQLTLFF